MKYYDNIKIKFSPTDIENAKNYKYSGTDDSICAKLFLRKYWDYLINFFPLTMAPNLITLIGFSIEVFSFLVAFFASDFLSQPVPWWVCFLSGISVHVYQTLDNLDGRQARRTGNSSPLGQFFDHGCDAIVGVLEMMKVAISFNFGNSSETYYFVFLMSIGFFLTAWEEYVTHSFYLGIINGPDEGLILFAAAHIFAGIIPTSWAVALSINALTKFLFVCGFLFSTVPILINVVKQSLQDKEKMNRAIISLIPALITIVIFTLIALNSSQQVDSSAVEKLSIPSRVEKSNVAEKENSKSTKEISESKKTKKEKSKSDKEKSSKDESSASLLADLSVPTNSSISSKKSKISVKSTKSEKDSETETKSTKKTSTKKSSKKTDDDSETETKSKSTKKSSKKTDDDSETETKSTKKSSTKKDSDSETTKKSSKKSSTKKDSEEEAETTKKSSKKSSTKKDSDSETTKKSSKKSDDDSETTKKSSTKKDSNSETETKSTKKSSKKSDDETETETQSYLVALRAFMTPFFTMSAGLVLQYQSQQVIVSYLTKREPMRLFEPTIFILWALAAVSLLIKSFIASSAYWVLYFIVIIAFMVIFDMHVIFGFSEGLQIPILTIKQKDEEHPEDDVIADRNSEQFQDAQEEEGQREIPLNIFQDVKDDE